MQARQIRMEAKTPRASMKKNIPGLWLLLLDVAVALAGFCTGVHFFWKDQNEGGVVVAGSYVGSLGCRSRGSVRSHARP